MAKSKSKPKKKVVPFKAKSAKKAKPASKARKLPGMENAAIQELEDAALDYAEVRDQRMAFGPERRREGERRLRQG